VKEILEWMLGLGKRSLDWILGRLAASFFSGQLRARWPKRQQAKQRSGSRQFANLWSLPRHLKHLPANVFL